MQKVKTDELLDKFHKELMSIDDLQQFASKLMSHLDINMIKAIPEKPLTRQDFNKLIDGNEQLAIKEIIDVKKSSQYIYLHFEEIIAKCERLIKDVHDTESLPYEKKVVTILETKYLFESIANQYSVNSRLVFAPNAYIAIDIKKEATPQRIPFGYLKLSDSAINQLSEIFNINHDLFKQLARHTALAIDKLVILSYTQKTYTLPPKPGKNLVAALAIALTKTAKPLIKIDNRLHQTLLDDLTTFFGLEPMKISTVYNDLLRNKTPSKDLRELSDALDSLKKNRPHKK